MPEQSGPRPTPNQPLSCSIDGPRAPEGGMINVRGVFSQGARVQIGGRNAVVVNRAGNQLRVRVPGSSGGGMVRVTDGGRSVDCGHLEVIGR